LGTPPVVIPYVDKLGSVRVEAGQLVGASEHGPALLRVVVLEGQRILSFPDVLGHDIDTAPDTHREVVELEARVGLVQIELDCKIVHLLNSLDPFLERSRVVQIGCVAEQHLDGEYDIVGRVRLAVTPLDAVADLERPHVQGVVGCETLAQPRLDLAGLIVEDEERLRHYLVKAMIAAATRNERIPQGGISHLATIDVEDDGVLAGGLGVISARRGSLCCCRSFRCCGSLRYCRSLCCCRSLRGWRGRGTLCDK
jgi:hypothetical protein